MKKSLAAFSAWALILALSVFVPIYILLTGTASLMPFAQAGAVAVCVIGLFLAAGAAALIVRAERKADISAHASLVKSKDALSTFPLWRSVFVFLRTITQAVLLLALGEPLFAAFAIIGLIGMIAHKGMLDAYFDRLPSGALRTSEKRKPEPRFIAEHDATIGWLSRVNSKRPVTSES